MTALAAITNLKKLCSHPELIYDKCQSGVDGFEDTLPLFPVNFDPRYVIPPSYFFMIKVHVLIF